MGGGPSISAPPPMPQAPPQPSPREVAQATTEAWTNFYNNALNSYIGNIPRIAEAETTARIAQQPKQRALERQLSALDYQAFVQSGLQLEREYGGQRTLETLRRQYEQSPTAFALNRALGEQYARQFGQIYGVSPFASVPGNVAQPATARPVDVYGSIPQGLNPKVG
jgi:hypothetical protein